MFQDSPAWVAHQRKRWLRPDWQRWFREGAHDSAPWATEVKSRTAMAEDVASELTLLRADHDRVRQMLAEVKFELAWRRIFRKYSPDQPRVPAGNPDGGQWTDGGSGQPAKIVRLAGEIPTNDTPKIPRDRPPRTRDRNNFFKAIARRLRLVGGPIGQIVKIGTWIYEGYPLIKAYLDEPKTLDELRDAVSSPARGYDIHHIVERTSAEQDGFPRSQIDDPENLTRIPTLKHWEISGWYQTRNDDFGGLSPREFLRQKDWNTRMQVGLDALVKFEILKR